ncbi:NAD-dependent epimerase/dehydratase family protein [Sphingobacterium sp. SRCM116780]|uniref:NAD-dependent epimerase/dehydratase family protein n=1 Tax=Sphingobacterium sp. SRCM116780 TaxID=2907623 RepID=UPI001F1D1007|nr:NAD-dependent epimerase/dehydratase family protein [Sphingobacterium sp. SRCM116780]UIR54990.1 NAD-dependent epimerase/dehydratase family protein [Sphingobacterium sp. SRCM116780]
MRIILTGATGMVGEGVLFECIQNPDVQEILMVNRKHYSMESPKLKELIIPNFMKLEDYQQELAGYDACFYCAGISSIGMDEKKYTEITYDTTTHFATQLTQLNPNMVFTFVSGAQTDSTETGKTMWARVKGKTENALLKLPLKSVYNFRPGFMKPFKGQKNVKSILKVVIAIFPYLFPKKSLTMEQVGKAMINVVKQGYAKAILEIEDIKTVSSR